MKKPGSSLRILFWVGLCLVLIAALAIPTVLQVKNLLSQHPWEDYQREAEAKGEIFSYAKLAPPPVPDDQNFAMTPLLRPIFSDPDNGQALAKRLSLENPDKADFTALPELGHWELGERADLAAWNTYLDQLGILPALKKYDAELDEISAASRRSSSRFPLHYQDEETISEGNPVGVPLLRLSILFELRALAELSAGQADRAAEDTVTILRLARAMRNEPILVSQLFSTSMARNGVQVVWEGLAARGWNDAQLARLQQELAGEDVVQATQQSLWGERIRLLELFDKLSGHNATMDVLGRIPQNKISADRLFNQYFLPTVDVAARRFNPAAERAGEQYLAANSSRDVLKISQHVDEMVAWTVLGIMADEWYGTVQKFAQTQTGMDEAAVACALERHRLAHGGYPATLDELAPSFIATLPHDVISGGPLHYERTAEGRFVLYAVGWNETDDHGAIVKDKDGNLDLQQGDWVWPEPAP